MGLKKNNPGCSCCGGSGDCPLCDPEPATVSVTLAGYANSGCTGCADLNGTYVLSMTASCMWDLTASVSCGTLSISAVQTAVGSVSAWTVYAHLTHPTFGWNSWQWVGVSDTWPVDCSATESLSLLGVAGNVILCDPWGTPATCDIN